MIAKNNEILTSASKSLYEYNSDWLIRERCRAREDFECHEHSMQERLDRANAALAEKDQALAEKDNALAEKEARIQELEALLKKQTRECVKVFL